MTVKTLFVLGALSTFALAASATAQTPAAGPSAATSGTVVAGVCTYWNEKVLQTSAPGKGMNDRLKQIAQQIQADLVNDENNLGAEQRRIEALPKDQIEAQAGPFREKVGAYQQKRQSRGQDLQYTQAHQTQRLGAELDPILNQLYLEKGCSILFERNQYLFANQAMDITDVAIQRLNTKMPVFPQFDLEHAPQQGAAPAPAAAPPAATPAATTKKKK